MRCINRSTLTIFLGAVLVVIFLGCSHNVVVAPARPDKIRTEKLPIDVGLYISESFKNYKVSKYKMGDKWNYMNLGQASATQFQLALGLAFNSVELVKSKPPIPSGKGITVHAIVEPAIDRFDFDIPLTKFQVYPAQIYYTITVYDTDGNVIMKKTVEGIGDTKGRPGFDFTENPSVSASKAVEDGVKKAVELIITDPVVRKLKK